MNFIFSGTCKMCLVGDIKVRVYYSLSGNAHLSDCGIGIVVYVLLLWNAGFSLQKSFTFHHETNKCKFLWNNDKTSVVCQMLRVHFFLLIILFTFHICFHFLSKIPLSTDINPISSTKQYMLTFFGASCRGWHDFDLKHSKTKTMSRDSTRSPYGMTSLRSK